MILRIALEIVGDRGFVLSVGALSNMSGFCIVCWDFVLSVGALSSNLMFGRPQHGVGWGGWGGIPYGYISILDIGYWIYISNS